MGPFETKPKLFAIQGGKFESDAYHTSLMERVKNDLMETYPQLKGKISRSEIVGPLYRGLSHTPCRYGAKGVRPQSNYPGLFCGGSDLTIGECFSASLVGGWLAANAVAGYQPYDLLYLDKNISSDIAAFLEPPELPDGIVKDLAVDVIVEETAEKHDKGTPKDPPDLIEN